MQVSDSVTFWFIYTGAVFIAGMMMMLHLTSKDGLYTEMKQMLSDFVRNKLGL